MKKIDCEGVGDNDGFFEIETSERSPVERGVIKPCPFCGGEGKLYVWDDEEHLVFCGAEDCEVRPQSKVKKDDEKAIEAWNKRAL